MANPTVRNPTWSRDELILALDLYMTNPTSPPGKTSKAVYELSQTLNEIGRREGRISENQTFRNEAGIYMKMMNFRRFDPQVIASGAVGLRRGNKDEEVVWNLYADDLEKLRQVAAAIRSASSMDASDLPESGAEIDDSEEAPEGRVLTRLHRIRERNKTLIEKKKAQAVRLHGRLQCEVCDFDFREVYGERGEGFIEVHHMLPLHTLPGEKRTKLDDLALLCSNCHRMIHARKQWLSLEALKTIIKRAFDERLRR